ncbi:helix-turn-helix domain-containing protein [Nocardia thailandica]|uniref:Helix-turn-helix domain-containing protein n=1 Tax=Nocardia thailandica TaxID=257275 RepID=A0ABW6PXM4_9NOCA
MSDFGELRRQLRIAYGKVIEALREGREWNMKEAAKAVGLSMNTYRRTEMGEREVTAPELDIIAGVYGVETEVLASQARAMVANGEIPSHAERAAESWRSFLGW